MNHAPWVSTSLNDPKSAVRYRGSLGSGHSSKTVLDETSQPEALSVSGRVVGPPREVGGSSYPAPPPPDHAAQERYVTYPVRGLWVGGLLAVAFGLIGVAVLAWGGQL